jgi:hypothetical protein
VPGDLKRHRVLDETERGVGGVRKLDGELANESLYFKLFPSHYASKPHQAYFSKPINPFKRAKISAAHVRFRGVRLFFINIAKEHRHVARLHRLGICLRNTNPNSNQTRKSTRQQSVKSPVSVSRLQPVLF